MMATTIWAVWILARPRAQVERVEIEQRQQRQQDQPQRPARPRDGQKPQIAHPAGLVAQFRHFRGAIRPCLCAPGQRFRRRFRRCFRLGRGPGFGTRPFGRYRLGRGLRCGSGRLAQAPAQQLPQPGQRDQRSRTEQATDHRIVLAGRNPVRQHRVAPAEIGDDEDRIRLQGHSALRQRVAGEAALAGSVHQPGDGKIEPDAVDDRVALRNRPVDEGFLLCRGQDHTARDAAGIVGPGAGRERQQVAVRGRNPDGLPDEVQVVRSHHLDVQVGLGAGAVARAGIVLQVDRRDQRPRPERGKRPGLRLHRRPCREPRPGHQDREQELDPGRAEDKRAQKGAHRKPRVNDDRKA